ncbi:hypothetical protein C8R43DRAFT_965894 [Mycena crocata]|nr:hypothetical protein C8R43DRAFT_965894 [Mycena crocata]
MPLLRELDLTLDKSFDETPVMFHSAPLLCTVILHFDSENVAAIALPWAQLTSLTLDGILPEEATPILNESPNLRYCNLSLICDDEPKEEPDVTLRCLESLVLDWEDDSPRHYLASFVVPSLRSLEIPDYFLQPDPIRTLTAFIGKSRSNRPPRRIPPGEVKKVGVSSVNPGYRICNNTALRTEFLDDGKIEIKGQNIDGPKLKLDTRAHYEATGGLCRQKQLRLHPTLHIHPLPLSDLPLKKSRMFNYTDKAIHWLSQVHDALPAERKPRTFADVNCLTRRIAVLEKVLEGPGENAAN